MHNASQRMIMPAENYRSILVHEYACETRGTG
nr:MAG TPA: hypothetical protein [Caudoviricetes sp.]